MKAVLRTAKLKTFGNVGGVNAHCTRTMDVPNADKEREHLNEIFIGTKDMVGDVKKRITDNGISLDKLRKDGVLAFEMILSASPEYFEITGYSNGQLQIKEPEKAIKWIEKTNNWLKEEFGENLVTTHLHLDEDTPHFHAIVVPIVPIPLEKQKNIEGKETQIGKLNCKHFLGGREKLMGLQDRYAEAVQDLGIERGIRGSKAKHVSQKEYNASKEKELNEAKKLELENIKLDNQLQQERAKAEQLKAQEIEARNRILQAQLQEETARKLLAETTLQNEKLTAEKQIYETLKKSPPTHSNLLYTPLPSLQAKEIVPEKVKTNFGIITKEEHERVIENLKKQFNDELKNITGKAGEYIYAGYEILKKEMEEVKQWKQAFEMSKRLEVNKSQQQSKNNNKGMSM